MAVTDLSVLGTNGTAFFGVATSGTWAQFRTATSCKNLSVDGTLEIVSRSLSALGGAYEYDHTLFQFDTSGISNAVAAEFRINCTSITGTPTAVLFRGNAGTPFSSNVGGGFNKMLNWPSSPTPLSDISGTAITTGLKTITLNADGVSLINSGHTLQMYLLETHQANDATAPTGTDEFRAIFNTTNLALRVTTPDPTHPYSLTGKIKILNGKISLE